MYCFFDENLNREVINISPGEYFISEKGMLIHTLIGSYVSVVIYDPVLKAGGMNHFMVAKNSGAKVMRELLDGLMKKGSMKNDLKAKILGGSIFSEEDEAVASSSLCLAEEFLESENIAITNRSTGGDKVRKIYYYPDSFKVLIGKLKYPDPDLDKQMAEYRRRLNLKKTSESSKKINLAKLF